MYQFSPTKSIRKSHLKYNSKDEECNVSTMSFCIHLEPSCIQQQDSLRQTLLLHLTKKSETQVIGKETRHKYHGNESYLITVATDNGPIRVVLSKLLWVNLHRGKIQTKGKHQHCNEKRQPVNSWAAKLTITSDSFSHVLFRIELNRATLEFCFLHTILCTL